MKVSPLPPRGSRSVWMERPLPETGPLEADASADVCVVGAGITGMLTALNLAREGRTVIVLDDGPVAGGETCKSTAHAVTALDDRAYQLERMHGKEGSRLVVESHSAAVDYLEKLAGEMAGEPGGGCGFMRLDGYLVVGEKHRDKVDELLERELAASHRAGITDAGIVDAFPDGWAHKCWKRAIRYPRQSQLDPVALLRGVMLAAQAAGVKVHTGTHVSGVHGGADAHVETDGGPVVRAAHIVVATNTPVNDVVVLHTKQAGYQTYALSIEVAAGTMPPALLWNGLWEDDTWYHYVRLRRGHAGSGHDELIVGGEDHKTGQDHDDHQRHERLEAWARERFPALKGGAVTARWSGEVMEPADGLAYIGRNPMDKSNVYITTGDSGNGITHGAIAGMLLRDLIMGRDNPWAKLYDPARKIGLSALRDYTRENLNTAAQYADWLRSGEADSESDIRAGTGAIISHGLKKLAVYKDPAGRCTRLNATCTHLGGVVRWNAEEKSWDCPCHGSRFATDGSVLHGPAITGLAEAAGGTEPEAVESDPVLPAAAVIGRPGLGLAT